MSYLLAVFVGYQLLPPSNPRLFAVDVLRFRFFLDDHRDSPVSLVGIHRVRYLLSVLLAFSLVGKLNYEILELLNRSLNSVYEFGLKWNLFVHMGGVI